MQHANARVDQAAAASGAYREVTASRQSQAETVRKRFRFGSLIGVLCCYFMIPQMSIEGGLGVQAHVKRPGSNSFYIWIELRRLSSLDLASGASQTRFMAHTYLLFDFGNAEEKAQQARHKLDVWKQAFRLDKKLTYKFDRIAAAAADAPEPAQKVEPASKSAKAKTKGKSGEKSSDAVPGIKEQPANGKVNLLVKLYFSTHEKLSEQRWVERIPSEEPFKDAAPRVVRQTDAQFDEVLKQFDALV